MFVFARIHFIHFGKSSKLIVECVVISFVCFVYFFLSLVVFLQFHLIFLILNRCAVEFGNRNLRSRFEMSSTVWRLFSNRPMTTSVDANRWQLTVELLDRRKQQSNEAFCPACKERISLSAFCGQFIKMIAFIWQIDQMWIVCDERRMRKEKRSREGNKNEMCLWWRLPYNDELMQAYYFDRCECHTFNKQCKRRRIYF